MTDYLPDATDFTDMDVKVRPDLRTDSARMPGSFVLCPRCHGHGGWNLRLNAYGKPGDAPIMRHFRAFCSNCWGWGWTAAGSPDAVCIHEFKEIAPSEPYRCWHTIRCERCGHTKSYDSSD